MDIPTVLKHCFHRVKSRLDSNDIAILDQHIPNENNYRLHLANYIEELSAPFTGISDGERDHQANMLIFRKYYNSHESLKNMLSFLHDFAKKPVSDIDQNHHAEGMLAFKNFIRRWENNTNGSDLMQLYYKYIASFD